MADVTTAAPAPRPQAPPRGRAGAYRTVQYVAWKLAGAAAALVAVILTGFFLFRILPGDPVRTMTHGRPVSIEQIEQLRRSFGLDKSLPEQFAGYLTDLLRFDLGESFVYHRPVSELIADRLWPTVLLVGTATLVSTLLGLALGIRGAWRHGSTGDRVNTGVALALWSMPTFWVGLILIVVFSSGRAFIPGLFPTGAMSTPGVTGWERIPDTIHHLVLPVVTLVAVLYAQSLLIMRSSLLDEIGSDYLVTARAKGLRDAAVRRRHAVPNALLPTTTLIFLNVGQIVSGTILVETVFSWPGLGKLFYEGIRIPDLPLVQGMFIFFAAAVILANLLADLIYPILDPRVRP
jgi:peptide/nickel transport system permease protein